MFTLFYGLYEYLFKREEFHILILGLDKAGKTNVGDLKGQCAVRSYMGRIDLASS